MWPFCFSAILNNIYKEFLTPFYILSTASWTKFFICLFCFQCEWIVCLHVCLWVTFLVPSEAREDIRFSRTRLTDSCEPPYGCWGSNLRSPGEKPVLLTTELSHLSSPRNKTLSFKNFLFVLIDKFNHEQDLILISLVWSSQYYCTPICSIVVALANSKDFQLLLISSWGVHKSLFLTTK